MSFAPGWRGTNTIAREMEEKLARRISPEPKIISDHQKPGTGIPNDNIMAVKAKFTCHYVQKTYEKDGITQNGVNVWFGAVYGNGEENKSWSAATPSGQLNMFISNPAIFDSFEQGKNYYLIIEPAE